METKEIILHWIDLVESVPTENFTAISEFASLPGIARAESLQWCERFFTEQADPHNPQNGARHSYLIAGKYPIDLLRHEYEFESTNVVVTEGVNFTLIRVKPKAEEVNTKGWRTVIEEMAKMLLNMHNSEHKWAFQFTNGVGEETIVSTNPSVDPFDMASWSGRADVLIRNGALNFICYKKYPPTLGFLHDAQWFDDDFRGKR